MKQTLADRHDGEEMIDTKLGGVHLTDKELPSMPLVGDMGIGLLIMRKNTNSRTNRCTLMEQSLQTEVMERN